MLEPDNFRLRICCVETKSVNGRLGRPTAGSKFADTAAAFRTCRQRSEILEIVDTAGTRFQSKNKYGAIRIGLERVNIFLLVA